MEAKKDLTWKETIISSLATECYCTRMWAVFDGEAVSLRGNKMESRCLRVSSPLGLWIFRGPSLQNRRNFLRILGEWRRKRGEREARVACEGRSAKSSRLSANYSLSSSAPRHTLNHQPITVLEKQWWSQRVVGQKILPRYCPHP